MASASKIWRYSLFQIPAVLLVCSLLGLAIASALQTDCFSAWRYLFIGLAWASFMWMLVLPIDYLLQKFLRVNMSLAGRLSILNAIFWSALVAVVLANNLPKLISSCQITLNQIRPLEISRADIKPFTRSISRLEARLEEEAAQEEKIEEPEPELEEISEPEEPDEVVTEPEEPEPEPIELPEIELPVEEVAEAPEPEIPEPVEEEPITVAELESLNLDWRPWKAAVWNSLFYGRNVSGYQYGARAEFEFRVDKDGNISDVFVDTPNSTAFANYARQRIISINRTPVLNFPDSSERSQVIYEGVIVFCNTFTDPRCGERSLPEHYDPDNETIIRERR